MTAFDDVRRARTQVMVAFIAVGLLLAGTFGFFGVQALRDYKGATKVDSAARQLPLTPVGLLATVDEADTLTSVTLMVLRPGDRQGGSILSIPVSVDSSLGVGDVRVPFTESYATGGIEALQFAVESALTVSFDVVSLQTSAQLAIALAPIGADLAASTAAALTERDQGQLERDRRSNIESAWSAIVESVGDGVATPPVATSPAGTYATLDDITARLFAGPIEARGLPTAALDPAKNPEGKDVEALDHAEAVMVIAAIAPASVSTPAPGMVFRIEAPAGYDEKVKIVIGYLLAIGGNVKSVILSAPAQPASVLLIGDAKFREQIESQGLVIGDLDMQVPDDPILGIDVIMVLGTDFLDALQTNDPTYVNPTTSTTSTTTA